MPTADELYQEANCFLCYGITQTQALKLALLRRQALELDPNADVSPETLLANASCYNCYANGSVGDLLELALLAIIAATPCTGNVDGLIWGPTPETVDEIAGDLDSVLAFLFTLTNGSNYTTLSFGNPTHTVGNVHFSSSALMTSLTFRLLETVGGDLAVDGSAVLTSFSAPLLQSIAGDLNFDSSAALLNLTLPSLTSAPATILVTNGVIETLSLPVMANYPVFGITADASLLTLNLPAVTDDGAGQLWLDISGSMSGLVTLNLNSVPSTTATSVELNNSPNLASVNLDSLVTVNGNFNTNSNSLTSLSLPSLVTVTVDFLAFSSLLISFSAPLWVPTDGTTINFNGCALDIPSVELILRRCVLAGVVACTIDLSGGTNAGTASLSAQGQADVATLGAQVTMNP